MTQAPTGTDDREARITRAFVSMASSLANGDDAVELLHELTVTCVDLLDIKAAGLLLADGRGVLHVLAASSEQIRLLEVFQLQRAEGPCRDCYHSSAAVLVADLQEEAARWPAFVPAALEAGYRSVHAVPMRLRETTMGVMGLFGDTTGVLNADDLTLGQALADVATVALIQDRASVDKDTVNAQLQNALNSRVVLEQAKGILAQRGDLDMSAAFAALRRYARDHNLRLSDVAQALVQRELRAVQLLDHSRNRNS